MSILKLLFNRDNFLVFLIAVGFFLSQFYLWSSGLPQFSHLLIILAIVIFSYRGKIISTYLIKIFFIFLIYVILVNIVWYFIYLDFSYISSTIYWIFNFLFFLLMVSLVNKDNNKENFKRLVLFLIPFSYFLEIFIWLTGVGRYYFSPRYNGLFNDPNQMAFWVLSSCSIYLFLSDNKFKNILVYVLSLILIVLTMSRSATLGFLILTLGLIFQHKSRLDFKIIFSLISLVVAIALFSILLKFGLLDNLLVRFSEGVQQNDDQVSSRGFDILINFPEYLLFGAGQGAYYLYSSTGNEIHSTWFGILFYYGIVGFFLFVFFLFNIFKKLDFAEKFIFLGPMIYGFFTYNARTLAFWFLVVIFLLYSKHREQS